MSRAPVLHQETRLSLSPASPSQVLYINTVPESQSSSFGAGRKRGFDEISGLDEASYARKHLATEASIFFRRKDRSPRSFLWRVLEDGKVLEIQSVDIVHDRKQGKSEGWLTFRIQLPHAILSNGVAFADPKEHDALEVFVLTSKEELFTFTLKHDLLTRETVPQDFDATSVFRKYTSSSLSYRHAYRLTATSSLDLLVSLHDGGVLQLNRSANESGAQWHETIYSEGNWSDTIRGLISLKRHQTLRFGDFDLDSTAIAAMGTSPDGKYLWTVSLDHELKAWSTKTKQPIWRRDLLNQRISEEERRRQRYVMAAEPGTLMQIVTLPSPPPTSASTKRAVAKVEEDGSYYIVLRSPKDNQFKFYQVSSQQQQNESDEEKFAINDLQPAAKLITPIDELLDTSMYHLESFSILPGPRWQDSQIWIRARNGKICRTFTLTFSLLDRKGEPADIEQLWQSGWTGVDTGMQTSEPLQGYTDFPGELETFTDSIGASLTEKWLEFLFYPGRFNLAAIETALNIYRKGRSLPATSGRKGLTASEAPLKQRLSQAIASKIILRKGQNEQSDYERYQASIQTEWKTFYSLLRDLHTRRNESIALALDPQDALAWSIYADFVAPIRGTTSFEALVDNEQLLKDDALGNLDEEIQRQIFSSEESWGYANVLSAARGFASRLSPEFCIRLKDFVLERAVGHQSGDRESNEAAAQELYERLKFSDEVMDDDFQILENSSQSFGGLGELTDEIVIGVLELIDQEGKTSGANAGKLLGRYGDKLIVAVAQETLEKNRRVLLDLLTLVIFMYGDLDRQDLHPEFVNEIGPLYDAIVTRLKHNVMLSWLTRNEIAVKPGHNRGAKSSQPEGTEMTTVTLFERISIGDWEALAKPEDKMPELLTKWGKQLTHAASLWQEWDGMTGYIMAFLIKEKSYDLATKFQRFLSQAEESSSWLRYLEGRLLVATGDYAEASIKFQQAAPGMAEARGIEGADIANLLSAEEQNYFGAGQSRFYQHVLDLFDKLRIFSYAADFAAIALQHLEHGNDDLSGSLVEIDRRKGLPDSPAMKRYDDTREEIHLLREIMPRANELRVRLFTCLVETARFREAFDALAGIVEKPLKLANLSKLVRACIDRDAVETLLELPLGDKDLAREADATLLGLAKKSLAFGSSGGVAYHQILYAFRTQRGDFRGASEILYEYLQRLKYAQARGGWTDPEDETLVNVYVLLINTMACCGEEEGWLVADPMEVESLDGVKKVEGKRRLVTIGDVRKEYSLELDRRSDLLHGRFPLVGGEGMEIDVL